MESGTGHAADCLTAPLAWLVGATGGKAGLASNTTFLKEGIMKRKVTHALLALFLASAILPFAGCARKGGDAAYKKAFYTAHAVYGLDALGDLFEIFQKGGVVTVDGAKKGYQITDEGLLAVDEIGNLLKNGLPVNSFDRARTIIGAIKQAVANGAIKFKSPKAESAYANTVATIEVTINLIEAINAGRKKEAAELEKQQKAKAAQAQAAVAQAEATWYQDSIVRASLLASELTVLSNAEAPQIWAALEQRSKESHAENCARLNCRGI